MRNLSKKKGMKGVDFVTVMVFVLDWAGTELKFWPPPPPGYITLNNFLIGNGLRVLKNLGLGLLLQDPEYSDDMVHSADLIQMCSSSLNKQIKSVFWWSKRLWHAIAVHSILTNFSLSY